MIENAHKHLERAPPEVPRLHIIIDACREWGLRCFQPAYHHCFLRAGVHAGDAGRAYVRTARLYQNLCRGGAALLSITLVPLLMFLFIRGKLMPEQKNPVNRFLKWIYRPVIAWVMRWKKLAMGMNHRHMVG
jgi:Cu(I)/Ag(I) efflux system membrane protein CusA/SilA